MSRHGRQPTIMDVVEEMLINPSPYKPKHAKRGVDEAGDGLRASFDAFMSSRLSP